MIIDSHHHFWRVDRGDYHWLTEDLGPLYRDFGPSDLAPILDEHGVAGTVLVQAAQSEAETDYMLSLAAENPFVLGVAGWVDMESSDAPKRLADMQARSGGKLKAIRPMIQEIEDADWVLKTSLDDAFKAIVDLGLVFEALVFPIHLRNLHERLKKHSGIKTIIDHGAKPEIASGARMRWAADLEHLARMPNVTCKLSGLVTEAAEDWGVKDLIPYISEIFRLFGPGRVMWGSDWPVLNLASDYATWIEIAKSYCARFSEAEQEGIFAGNAIAAYGLDASDLRSISPKNSMESQNNGGVHA